MAKLLREFYELCEGGVCQDLLTEAEKRFVNEGGMMLTGKLQEADHYYTLVLQSHPKHPDANHNMGVLAVGVGKVQEALPFF